MGKNREQRISQGDEVCETLLKNLQIVNICRFTLLFFCFLVYYKIVENICVAN